jgi:hypothetical protein
MLISLLYTVGGDRGLYLSGIRDADKAWLRHPGIAETLKLEAFCQSA